jgi:2'-5' RNA ligase
MRLFIALDLPGELRAWAQERQGELKRFFAAAALRWMPADQWHVTLRFLGEWPERKTAAALAAMKRAAQETPPFSMSLGKPGCFSGPRMGALWLGVDVGKESLAQLAASLNNQLEAEGFPKEVRPFRGHVTLARGRQKISSAELRRFSLSPPCPEAPIHRLHLYQSVLDSQGARYMRLHTV